MKVKELNEYSDRELLELLISNQVRMEQRLYKIYWYLDNISNEDIKKNRDNNYQKEVVSFQENNIHKGEVFNDFIKSYKGLNMQISDFILKDKNE